MKQQLTIKGMKCEGCVNNVQQNLASISTVEKVSVDLDNQTADVDSLTGITEEEAQEALAATAYQVTAIQ
ncbi:heavy-metal-associated domain-containing protein [Marinilactibacillus kalidii]|uniref:heavy-metal-associated domain-containing protein n=1 Tax=Marinilactibacillus kalidii TaxID=2820274 RepID=UPI001ABE2416|nr:heavy-metal-associated domain-containing protein [Marinilactibacillus kalidii]